MQVNPLLCIGAALSAMAAVLHIAIVIKGAAWYRYFGAGETFAVAAARGKLWPHVVTLGIAALLFAWSAYALSGAGVLKPLPQLPLTLLAITAIYLLRGAAVVPVLLFARSQATAFVVWSSAVCLAFGIVHAIGLAQVWSHL